MSGVISKEMPLEEIEALPWYHPKMTRHVAESLLMQNGTDGTYLLRPSSTEGELALSVRAQNAVKHYPVTWNGKKFKFGMVNFETVEEFTKHFINLPLVAGESGVLTALRYPYPKNVDEFNIYDTVRVHAEFGSKKISYTDKPHFQVGSKEGYLTKLGGNVKNWKYRWFVLVKNELKYFRQRESKKPIKTLDLSQCIEIDTDITKGKDLCFKLEFPWRTFYFYASSESERKEWMDLISWKLNLLKATPLEEEEEEEAASASTASTASTEYPSNW